MGYLNNESIILDAILTKRGRELLSKGTSQFNITQFAIADDEIDYGLWNPNHSQGSNYFGIVIENLPMLEATPDQSQILKYKLVTLGKNTTRLPVIDIGQTSVTLQAAGQSYTITPQTINFENGNSTFGYTAIINDSSVCDLQIAPGGELNISGLADVPNFVGDGNKESITAMGKKFTIIAKNQPTQDATTTLTLIGNETGGRAVLNIIVKRQTIQISQPIITNSSIL